MFAVISADFETQILPQQCRRPSLTAGDPLWTTPGWGQPVRDEAAMADRPEVLAALTPGGRRALGIIEDAISSSGADSAAISLVGAGRGHRGRRDNRATSSGRASTAAGQ